MNSTDYPIRQRIMMALRALVASSALTPSLEPGKQPRPAAPRAWRGGPVYGKPFDIPFGGTGNANGQRGHHPGMLGKVSRIFGRRICDTLNNRRKYHEHSPAPFAARPCKRPATCAPKPAPRAGRLWTAAHAAKSAAWPEIPGNSGKFPPFGCGA